MPRQLGQVKPVGGRAVSRERTEHWGATPAGRRRGWGTCRAGWPRRGRRPAAEALLGPGGGGEGVTPFSAQAPPLASAGAQHPLSLRAEWRRNPVRPDSLPQGQQLGLEFGPDGGGGLGGGSGHSLPGPRKSSKVAFRFGLPSLPRPCYMAFREAPGPAKVTRKVASGVPPTSERLLQARGLPSRSLKEGGDRAGAVQARDGKYLEEERPSLQVEAGFWAGRKGRGLGPAVAMASCLCPRVSAYPSAQGIFGCCYLFPTERRSVPRPPGPSPACIAQG